MKGQRLHTPERDFAARRGTQFKGRSRAGLTIVDAVAVFACVAALLAVLTPSLGRIQKARRAHSAATTLMSRLSACRVHAQTAGRAYDFHFEPGGRRYLILPAPIEISSGNGDTSGNSTSGNPPTFWGELPEGVQFDRLSGNGVTQQIGLERLSASAINAWAAIVWSAPIRFHDDGRGTDSLLVLTDDEGRTSHLQVRQELGRVRLLPQSSRLRKAAGV